MNLRADYARVLGKVTVTEASPAVTLGTDGTTVVQPDGATLVAEVDSPRTGVACAVEASASDGTLSPVQNGGEPVAAADGKFAFRSQSARYRLVFGFKAAGAEGYGELGALTRNLGFQLLFRQGAFMVYYQDLPKGSMK